MKKWSEDTWKECLQGLTWGTLYLREEKETRFIKAIQATHNENYFVTFFSMLTVGPKQLANDQLNRKCVRNKYNQSFECGSHKNASPVIRSKITGPSCFALKSFISLYKWTHQAFHSQKPPSEWVEKGYYGSRTPQWACVGFLKLQFSLRSIEIS